MSQPQEPRLLERRDGPVLVLTLNRPQVRNAVDLRLAELLAEAMDRLDADPELRIAVLTGAGSDFCSGMDLSRFVDGEHPELEGRGFAGFVERPPAKPLIAAVEGNAVAGGFEIALACDLIVASREASFSLPEVKRGLLAAAGGLLGLAHKAPANLAMELVLTGASLPAERAAELGIVNRLAEPGRALSAALELAAEIAANAPLPTVAAKRILGMVGELRESECRRLQRQINARILASEDAREGALAFTEKRQPTWSGR